MITIREIKKKTEIFFYNKKLKSPKLDTDILLANLLKIKRLDLYLNLDRPLNRNEVDKFREQVRRRGKREPLQYILGEVEFYNCKIQVDKRALIPRPETEYLVELIFRELRSKEIKNILELGTGTGAISIALKKALEKEKKQIKITATDNSEDSIELARLNVKNNNLDEGFEIIKSNWFKNINSGLIYDIIISNPPYLSEKLYQISEPEVKEHEPKQSLVALEEGFADLKEIISDGIKFLSAKGILVLETGMGQHEELIALAKNLGYSSIKSIKDLNQIDRFLFIYR